ncbi:MAG: pectinesterase family protein, partial [Prevotella sp.]
GINRSGKDLPLTDISNSVSGVAADAANPLKLSISVLGLGNNKNVGINDIVIEGTMQGSINPTVKYALTMSVSPAEAGQLEADPAMNSYKEGMEVTITAKRNFGYRFMEWNVNGETAGTNEKLVVTMDEDKSVTAVFTQIPVYTVSTSCTNDAELSIGSITLSPNDNGGRYEEGSVVTATANESRILKFMQWTDGLENAGTNAVRSFTVNNDMKIVADYEVQDFVAVFDASATQAYAYNTTANYPFPADITWDSERAATACVVRVSDGSLVYSQSTGTPVVRNREGVVQAGINGLYQNGYDTRDIAWQYKFSTKGFTEVTFNADMAAKNAATKNYKLMYSTDGTTFADVANATWSMTANVIVPLSFTLPADAMDKENVYLRITGTGTELLSTAYSFTEEFDGLSYTSHSESGLGNVYVLGTADVADDDVPPVVTATLPATGATGVSASGNITISFDERIKAGSETAGEAVLKGADGEKVLTPVWNTRSVTFNYVALKYGESYKFVMPAGYATDRSGNPAPAVEVSFTIMDKLKPEARIFDAVVDKTLDLAHGEYIEATLTMPKQYRYIQDAIDDAPETNTRPYLIYIKAGYYNDANETFSSSYGTRYTTTTTGSGAPTETIPGGKNDYDDCRLIYVNKPNIHLIGEDKNKVTIATDRLAGGSSDYTRVWYHVNAAATLEVQDKATDFFMQGVTLDNENWTIKAMEGPQALAMNITSDRVVFDDINARSYQDTYKSNGTYNRQFFYNSTIEGGVDFIYGSGDVWFENCKLNINRKSGGFIVAPNHPEGTRWGYVFNNTTITTTYSSNPEDYQIYLGRPWHEYPITVFLHTRMEVKPYDGYWYPTMGGLPKLWAVYDIVDKNGYALSEKSIEEE